MAIKYGPFKIQLALFMLFMFTSLSHSHSGFFSEKAQLKDSGSFASRTLSTSLCSVEFFNFSIFQVHHQPQWKICRNFAALFIARFFKINIVRWKACRPSKGLVHRKRTLLQPKKRKEKTVLKPPDFTSLSVPKNIPSIPPKKNYPALSLIL